MSIPRRSSGKGAWLWDCLLKSWIDSTYVGGAPLLTLLMLLLPLRELPVLKSPSRSFLMPFLAIRSLLMRLLFAVCTGRPGPSQLQTLSGKWTGRMKLGRGNCLLLRLVLACKCSHPRFLP